MPLLGSQKAGNYTGQSLDCMDYSWQIMQLIITAMQFRKESNMDVGLQHIDENMQMQ